MAKSINIRKGYDIRLVGKAALKTTHLATSSIVAIQPPDFKAVMPKLLIKEGDEITAGQALFFDKFRTDILIPSPVSGEIVEIVRGAKRQIMAIRILADKQTNYQAFSVPQTLTRESVTTLLKESSCWSYVRQRPFATIANSADTPKGLFVSCFDSSPLAPDYSYIIGAEKENFQLGLKALSALVEGKLHVSIRAEQRELVGDITPNIYTVNGPHPAGNIGVQIHHISPIKPKEVAWYVNPQDVIIIGRLFSSGHYIAERTIALTGSEVTAPQYYRVQTGTNLNDILAGRINTTNTRIIQGNPLVGQQSTTDQFLSFYDNQLTVLAEGNKPELFGWLSLSPQKLSLSRALLSWLQPNKTYTLDTNTHGEERAFVVSGEYEKVLPMNILPVYLLKAILARDLERMEQLGIYEVAEEDFALCEFACTSKIDVQQIIADGLEYARHEG